MDARKIFLNKNRSIDSVNTESNIGVELERKTRLLPNENISDTFSLYDQYNRERDECTKFRIISTINPICSNVLYNMKSEIIVNEGGDNCEVLFDGETTFPKPSQAINTAEIKYRQAIMDTEYSHSEMDVNGKGPLVYHCGVDIFDNHMLRNDGFIHINKTKSPNAVFNTINDTLRNEEGDIITEDIKVKTSGSITLTPLHLYNTENLLSMKEAFLNRCKEKDGWWGFTNPGNIDIPNGYANQEINVNRMMANNKACEFIDLYPDRSLFSFVPKFNKVRKRPEKNWDYCITYPYAKDEAKLNEICGGKNQAIRAFVKKTVNNASTELMQCSCYFKHNLKANDYVYFYYYKDHVVVPETATTKPFDAYAVYNTNGELVNVYGKEDELPVGVTIKKITLEYQKFSIKTRVVSVGDQNGQHKDRIFNVNLSDVNFVYNNLEKIGCFYKKVDHNTECNYYFRKFKKIKSSDGNELKSDINKVAFGRNIYGDDIAQIVFTDDIDVNGLIDYNGRSVSDIFLTIVKRNAGYKEFYNYNGSGTGKRLTGKENVEFSHCFGKITSGIDFSGIEDEPFDYNAHYLHNIDKSIINNPFYTSDAKTESIKNTLSAWGDTVLEMPKVLEDDITIDTDEFYGDIVEFNYYTAQETTVGNVFHRFNTVQREMFDTVFMNIYHNVLRADDYDSVNGAGGTFNIETCYLNHITNKNTPIGNGVVPFDKLLFGNIAPEGYIYNPHTRIKIREIDGDSRSALAKAINYDKCNVDYVYNFRFAADPARGYDKEETFVGSALEETLVVDGRTVLSPKSPFNPIDSVYLRIKINVPVDYGFYCGDYMAFYDKETRNTIWGEIIKVDGLELTLSFDKATFNYINENNIRDMFDPAKLTRTYYAFWSEYNVPMYAKLAISTGRFYWRNIVPPSEVIKDSEVFDTPFTNGRFYIQKNTNFFLRRQDPVGKYGLGIPIYKKTTHAVSNQMTNFMISGYDPIDLSDEMAMIDSVINTCW